MNINTKTIAAMLVLTSAALALPQDSLAGKPDGRTPRDKACPFEVMSGCKLPLEGAYTLVGELLDEGGNFLSRNADKDAGTLKCKISGADIKLSQGKTHEASYLMHVALEKIRSLYTHRKLSADALADMGAVFTAAKECIDYL